MVAAILGVHRKTILSKMSLLLVDGKNFLLIQGTAEHGEYLQLVSSKALFLVLFYIPVAENASSAREKYNCG